MLDDLQPFAQSLRGYTELRAHRNRSFRMLMRKGGLIQNAYEDVGGTSARCHCGGAFGFAARPGGAATDIEQVLREARSNATLTRGKAGTRPLPQTEPGTGVYDYRTSRSRASAAERLEILRSLDAYVAREYPGLTNADLMLGTLVMEKALLTSEGASTYSYVPRSNLFLKFSIQANDGVVDLHELLGGFGDFEDVFHEPEWAYPAIDRLYESLRAKADGTFCEAGEHDVVVASDVAGILAHEAIGHTCEADLVLGGSVAGDFLGQPVAAEKFSLIDYAARGPDGRGTIAIHVDDEGTPCRDVTIIDKGVLKGFLSNKETARALDLEPAGNARAYTYSDEPLVRMRNTAIEPGDDRIEDMIAAIDEGYYLTRATNGQADATSEFMFGITMGYEIRNGRLGRAIRDTTISGVAFDVLKTVSHVSRERSWSRGGMCGKKQLIPVGMGGPALKCRLHVGGR